MSNFIVRISGLEQSLQAGTEVERLNDIGSLVDITRAIENLGFAKQIGNADSKITLSGENSVQRHINSANAFVFHGTPTIGECFKLVSLFVGFQTGDKNLLNPDGTKKPVIIYNPDFNANDLEKPAKEISDRYTLILKTLLDLYKAGTISKNQYPLDIISVATTPDVLEILLKQKSPPPAKSGHLFGKEKIQVAPELLVAGNYIERGYRPAKDRLRVCAFTSAKSDQDKTSVQEAYDLGKFVAKLAIGGELISGAGNTGLMQQVHNGCVKNGGLSSGANCPHIIEIEGVPDGMSRIWVAADIYERMEIMYENTDIVVIGAGGRGGAGTFQEFLGGLLLWNIGSDTFKPNPDFVKHVSDTVPIIVDNRLGMFTAMKRLAEVLGFEGKYREVRGTEQVTEKIRDILRVERNNGNGHRERERKGKATATRSLAL